MSRVGGIQVDDFGRDCAPLGPERWPEMKSVGWAAGTFFPKTPIYYEGTLNFV
jgi:hypothetical protein